MRRTDQSVRRIGGYRGAMRTALAVVLAIAIGACGGESDTRGRASPGPTLVRFEYRAAVGTLVVAARDRAGQVIGLTLEGPITTMADGRCGLGGRRNGQTTRFELPARRLSRGRSEFTVRLTGSSCDAESGLREATSQVTLTVSSDGSATATDERGRWLS